MKQTFPSPIEDYLTRKISCNGKKTVWQNLTWQNDHLDRRFHPAVSPLSTNTAQPASLNSPENDSSPFSTEALGYVDEL